MKLLKGFGIIFLCLYLGVMAKTLLPFAIPETVYAMVFLFLALCFRVIKVETVEDSGNLLLQYMALFFIPLGVAIIDHFEVLKHIMIPLLVIVVVSLVATMFVTAKVIEWVQKVVSHDK